MNVPHLADFRRLAETAARLQVAGVCHPRAKQKRSRAQQKEAWPTKKGGPTEPRPGRPAVWAGRLGRRGQRASYMVYELTP